MTSKATRREFLGVVGGTIALGAVTSLQGRVAGAVPSLSIPSGGARFAQPRELVSADGRLDVELVAAASQVAFGDGKRFAYTYNGTTPGPTLRVRPGDTLSIRLVNRLGETTNLHTHGLHVSPSGHADNVFVSVADGERRTYTYEIPPDHRSGTFWYHPHMHEMVASQVFGGLAGVIVVEDALDELPELAAATQRILVLSDPTIGDSSSVLDASMMEKMRGREGDVIVVNGLVTPTIASHAGTLEHWRMVNASPSRYYRLSLRGHPFTVIGTDGGRLSAPREAAEILLTPANAVRCSSLRAPPARTASTHFLTTGGASGWAGAAAPRRRRARPSPCWP